ncbi:MAG: hypothetical protein PVF17_04635 [Ignavibacteria bacterium]|jgi:hypothetical protein
MTTEQLALIVAALAVFFGPMIQLLINRKQIKAETSRSLRTEWIHQIISSISEYVATLYRHDDALNLYFNPKGYILEEEVLAEKRNTFNLSHQESRLRIQICLLLNPENDIHWELYKQLEKILKLTNEEPPSEERTKKIGLEVVELTNITSRIIQSERRLISESK